MIGIQLLLGRLFTRHIKKAAYMLGFMFIYVEGQNNLCLWAYDCYIAVHCEKYFYKKKVKVPLERSI